MLTKIGHGGTPIREIRDSKVSTRPPKFGNGRRWRPNGLTDLAHLAVPSPGLQQLLLLLAVKGVRAQGSRFTSKVYAKFRQL